MKSFLSPPPQGSLLPPSFIGDYQLFLTPRFIQQLLEVNAQRNAGGPFVLAMQSDPTRGVEICELQSESRIIRNARFERRLGSSDWVQVSAVALPHRPALGGAVDAPAPQLGREVAR